jgi:hypothetical protein
MDTVTLTWHRFQYRLALCAATLLTAYFVVLVSMNLTKVVIFVTLSSDAIILISERAPFFGVRPGETYGPMHVINLCVSIVGLFLSEFLFIRIYEKKTKGDDKKEPLLPLPHGERV